MSVTNRTKKRRLRKVLEKTMPPIHCTGCDEWGCGGWEEQDGKEELEVVLQAVWEEVQSWERENVDSTENHCW
ncbi:MAG: hypothetical protein KGL39_00105 [Patescibacteria group bacterium]|nr:hypothetical protein [Patescibacteria group bacterium]